MGIEEYERAFNDLIFKARNARYEYSDKAPSFVKDAIDLINNNLIRSLLGESETNALLEHVREIEWTGMLPQNRPEGNRDAWMAGKKKFIETMELLAEVIKNPDPRSYFALLFPSFKDHRKARSIFLCHSSKDKKYADAIAEFIRGIGVRNEQLIYTSHELHKIPLNKDIFEYIRERIDEGIFMIILWSDDCLDSPACMNEVGAAWAIDAEYTNIYVPGFDFNSKKYNECAIRSTKGIRLDGKDLDQNVTELKKKIVSMLGLKVDDNTFLYHLKRLNEQISKA